MHSDFRGKPENDIKDTYWTSSEGVGGNEVPTRGRLSPKKSYLRNVQKTLN